MALPEHIHFIGIGGAGMAPLAEILLARGVGVSGSDLESNDKCRALSSKGAAVFTGHHRDHLPEKTRLAVYSSAVPEENPERQKARELNMPQMRRGEFLAELLKLYRRVAAVSGSHGKSTITAMLTHILLACGLQPGYMIGAGVNDGSSSHAGSGDDIFITEADESDGTHKLLTPYLGIVPNADGDHAWSVGGEEALKENFRTFARRAERVICFDTEKELFAGLDNIITFPHPPEGFEFAGHVGFMALNAFLAVEAAVIYGCDRQQAQEAAASFKGIKRRMTVHIQRKGYLLIEDYAHHPQEVARSLEYLRLKYPQYHLRIVFQPHRYARLEKFFSSFSAVLQKADSLFIAPVFAAWSETGKYNSAMLAEASGGTALSGSFPEDARTVLQQPCDDKPLLVAVLGAGDIEKIIPYLS